LALQAKRAAESAAQRCYAEALTNALAVHFLKRYAAAHQTEGAVPSGLSPHKLRRATAYIDEHLEHELSLTKIAAVAHMSLAHFARLFRQDTGMTPHQFVLCRRIDRARQLLANTELPLCEISHRVGFADQSHFIAVFRKHVGLTPRLYRHHASGTSVET
jgi:AraC family transcriptional regulator